MKTVTTVTFTPVKRPLVQKLDGFAGTQLGKIFDDLGKESLEAYRDKDFVRGLVAAGVLYSNDLLEMLTHSDSVTVEVTTHEEEGDDK